MSGPDHLRHLNIPEFIAQSYETFQQKFSAVLYRDDSCQKEMVDFFKERMVEAKREELELTRHYCQKLIEQLSADAQTIIDQCLKTVHPISRKGFCEYRCERLYRMDPSQVSTYVKQLCHYLRANGWSVQHQRLSNGKINYTLDMMQVYDVQQGMGESPEFKTFVEDIMSHVPNHNKRHIDASHESLSEEM